MDLSKLIQPQWVFHSETAGDWDVYFYSVKAASIIEKQIEKEAPSAIEAIRAIMGVMLKSRVEDQEGGEKSSEPTEAELAAFTEDDVIRFSREFLENDKSFEPDPEIERSDGQSDADYLLSVLVAENKKQSARLGEMFASLKGSLGGLLGSKNLGIRSVSEDLLKQSEGLESLYGTRSGIWGPSPAMLEPIDLPPNPIHETNERLGDMAERLENLVGFGENALRIMNGLQVASAEFLENFSNEAEKNSKAANKAILVGIFAIVFSVAQIAYTEYWRVPQDSAAMDAALTTIRGEIDELQTALGNDVGSSQAAIESVSATVAEAVKSTGDTNSALLQTIEQLLRQQRARDQAILEALERIAATVTQQPE
ncbi:hypothetical protein D2N39_22175 [Gemmobacter lutimaris]|uniref:Uncharacterized protein n=1 Tax=Gemmobacter lutimaris TaxID=2306023 RepID=A0A398BM99_9RHOB|nr:hypothetical protein [Gemmobacter lutimaris]RID89638.1 hypothetical protein D2N39_22175 [Gemmobacter lutimaris]